MKGIKRKCRLVVVVLLKGGIITTTTEISDHDSITHAEECLQAKKGDFGQIDGKVIYSKITPLDQENKL